MDSEPEFESFEELPSATNPRKDFAEIRAGEKIIRIPYSIWKDGRIRADLSRYGAGCPVSRNEANITKRMLDELESYLGEGVELVRQIRLTIDEKPIIRRLRRKNKLNHGEPVRESLKPDFINPKPLIGTPGWEFGPSLRWLNKVEGISQAEKSVYGWMAFRADNDGVFRKSLRSVARDAGISWAHMSGNVMPSLLSGKRLLYRDDRSDGSMWLRFLRHPAMEAGGQLSWPSIGQAQLPRGGQFSWRKWPTKLAT